MASALLAQQDNVDRYMKEVRRHPLLSRDQERELAQRYRDHGDLQAAHRLVVANLRFVAKIAHQYAGYGLNLLDLIQEGNVGLMVAVQRFDPARGYRLISYAVWWIRAYIQGFILRSWSLVQVGLSRTQRKLFFKVRSERARVERDTAPDDRVAAIARNLQVSEGAVSDMEARLAAHDFSLDAPVQDHQHLTHLDAMPGPEQDPEQQLADKEEQALVSDMLARSWSSFSPNERHVIQQRLLGDEPRTLQSIGDDLHVSRERVRQLESRALGRLRTSFLQKASRGGMAGARA